MLDSRINRSLLKLIGIEDVSEGDYVRFSSITRVELWPMKFKIIALPLISGLGSYLEFLLNPDKEENEVYD